MWLNDTSDELSTVNVQSCIEDRMMNISSEQRKNVSNLYKQGEKIARTESHFTFLTKCLEFKVIPVSFQVRNSLPGNKALNQTYTHQATYVKFDYDYD